MANYLRHISCWCTTGNNFGEIGGLWHNAEMAAAFGEADVLHLCWMYERYATPLRTTGVAKVNICFTSAAPNPAPTEVDGVAEVYEYFDTVNFRSLPPGVQQRYYLDRFHAATIRCAVHFGWDAAPLERACQAILDAGFKLAFFCKKPVTGPDRRTKAQGFVEASRRTKVYVVFFDRNMRELRRSLLAEVGTGSGIDEHMLSKISWADVKTVRVEMKNGRDYWLCSIDGTVEFHYPRAEIGDRHAEYDLGKMYFDGAGVLPDRQRGLTLIRAAAAKGYNHAVRFLQGLEDGAEPASSRQACARETIAGPPRAT